MTDETVLMAPLPVEEVKYFVLSSSGMTRNSADLLAQKDSASMAVSKHNN